MDLEDNKYFSPAGDLENTVFLSKYNSKEEIVKYLSSVVSGKKYGFQSGMPYSSGSILVSFDELKKMVDNGDNIIKAECLDDNGKFISIEFESFVDGVNNKLGRGR